ncbi:MAG: hypothetical protein WAT77_13060 [Paracoccaceae bacterium]
MTNVRDQDIQTFYDLLGILTDKHPPRLLKDASGKDPWPSRGVYFLFEDGETRSNGSPRVVRIGTHGLVERSSSTLWGRLAQHRGTISPKGGNHRGSIFRDLVGAALAARSGLSIATWGKKPGSDAEFRRAEHTHEMAVSDYIGAMRVVWVNIPDEPGPSSLRGIVERNAIALLSNWERAPEDSPSSQWLGKFSDRERVRKSGLWNNNHVTETYDGQFLKIFESVIEGKPAQPFVRKPSPAPPIYVMQCAKSKKTDGWFRDQNNRKVSFVARPELAPPEDGVRFVHPDSVDEHSVAWRKRVFDYNLTFAETGQNPLGLYPAARLYQNECYGALAASVPSGRLYILSAGWGLVRSDYLLPNYDVSFSAAPGVPPHARRRPSDEWRDFNMLDPMTTAPVIFIGGQTYFRPFANLTRNYQGMRTAYYNVAQMPMLSGIEWRRFDTSARTNWHYRLARMLASGGTPDEEGLGLEVPAPARVPISDQSLGRAKRTGKHGKYSELFNRLTSVPNGELSITLTFAEIEELIGTQLPASARTHVAVWWANGGHVQASAWIDAGFRKKAHQISSANEKSWIRFERIK